MKNITKTKAFSVMHSLSPTQTLSNGTLKLFYSNNAISVLHHRPFLFGFISCVTFVTRWSCFYNCKHWTLWTYELML